MLSVLIDGTNIKSLGLFLAEGSLDGWFKYPKRKAVSYNDWAEADGIEADLTEFSLQPRSFTLTFCHTGKGFMQAYNSLLTFLSKPGYRTLEIAGVSRSVRLDVGATVRIPIGFDSRVSTCGFTFIEDEPQVEQAEPYCLKYIPSVFAVGSQDFMEFGIGSEDPGEDIIKSPRLKDPFTDGNMWDLNDVKSRHKETKLNLWMVADSPAEFVNNWRAFLAAWAVPGLVDLYITGAGISVPAYYTDCTSFSVQAYGDRGVGATFSISVVIPQCSWLSMGGTTAERGLYVVESDSFLTDEEGNVLIV